MANAWFTSGKLAQFDSATLICWNDTSGGRINKIMLVTGVAGGAPNYTFSAAHTNVSQITNEVSGTGYTGGFAGSGRKQINSPTVTVPSGTTIVLDGADVQWPNAGGTWVPGAGIIFRQKTGDAADTDLKLICYVDQGTASDTFGVATNGSNLDLIWAASGIISWN